MRYTPAGIEAVDFVLRHQSTQIEAGVPCQVQLELRCIGFGAMARTVQRIPPGARLQVTGFLRAARRGSSAVRLHVTQCNEV